MGDAPIAYVEGAGGIRVAEDHNVAVGKNDVCFFILTVKFKSLMLCRYCPLKLVDDRYW